MSQASTPHHVVIVGGGFAGLNLAKGLASNAKNSLFKVTLIDIRNFHTFQPLLFQVATGLVPPSTIAVALRKVLGRYKNMTVLNGKVVDIQPDQKKVVLADEEFNYDSLVVCTGVSHDYFGKDHWRDFASGLKTLEEAVDIRRRLLLSFETAERHPDPETKKALMRFVIVGAGPTGVELAGSIAELAHNTLNKDFKHIDSNQTEVILVEAAERVLMPFHPSLSEVAKKSLEKLGVTVLTKTFVTDVRKDGITIKRDDKTEEIPSKTILWAAGVKASVLGKILAERTGAELDRVGRVKVNPDLTVAKRTDIYVLGDLAHCAQADGSMVPGVATAAIQQGGYLAKSLKARIQGKPVTPYKYWNKGSLATIGKLDAVAQIGKFRVGGALASLLWAVVHIMYLIGFGNRYVVMTLWTFFLFSNQRGVRLITGKDAYHLIEAKHVVTQPAPAAQKPSA